MTKLQRKKMLEIKEKSSVKQNLFIKNLSEAVTEEQVKTAFSVFGDVTSVAVKSPSRGQDGNPKFKDVKTQFGYVCFETGAAAEKAVAEYSSQPELMALFFNNQPFVGFHLAKDKYAQQKKRGGRAGDSQNIMQLMQQQMKMFQNPQMFQMMMQMMMPMMNMQQ